MPKWVCPARIQEDCLYLNVFTPATATVPQLLLYMTGFWKMVPNHTSIILSLPHVFSIIFHSTRWNSMLKLLKECKKYSVSTYA